MSSERIGIPHQPWSRNHCLPPILEAGFQRDDDQSAAKTLGASDLARSPGLGLDVVRGGSRRRPAHHRTGHARAHTFHFGRGIVRICHNQTSDPDDKRDDRELWICRMDEFPHLRQQDKHKLAFAALTGQRGREIAVARD